MATSVVQERRKRLVNRVGRHLPCNTMEIVTEFARVSEKVRHGITIRPGNCELNSNGFHLARGDRRVLWYNRNKLDGNGGQNVLSLARKGRK